MRWLIAVQLMLACVTVAAGRIDAEQAWDAVSIVPKGVFNWLILVALVSILVVPILAGFSRDWRAVVASVLLSLLTFWAIVPLFG